MFSVLASRNKLQWTEPSIISGQIWLEGAGWSRRFRPSHNIPGHNDTFWWPFIKSVWLHTKLYHHAGNVKWKLSPSLSLSLSLSLYPKLHSPLPVPSLHYTQCSPHHPGPTKMSPRERERERSHGSLIENVWHLSVCLSVWTCKNRTEVNPGKSLRPRPQPYQDTNLKEKRKCGSFSPRNVVSHLSLRLEI